MKKQLYITLVVLASLMGAFTSCTKDFDNMNTNKYGVSDKEKEPYILFLGGYIPQMEKSIYYNPNNYDWDFQIMQNLSSDIYSGYLTPPTPFNNDKNNINYFMMDGWNSFNFNAYNNNLMKPALKVKEMTIDKKQYPEVYAVALVLKVMGMQQLTDLYGPIIYTKYGEGTVASSYDSQKVVYDTFFKELDQAQALFKEFLASPRKDLKLLSDYDVIFNSDYNKWMKAANSVRLRLAIRISKVNPQLAKAEAEKAMKDAAGVFETEDMIMPTKSMKNPLNVLAYAYNDTRMSADMQSIMVGLKDPRISRYFDYATDAKVVDKYGKTHYQGIRQGTNMINKKLRENYSNLAKARYGMPMVNSNPITLMSASEVYFLRAEGALRGWAGMGASAKELYEKGIESSFRGLSVAGADAYIANATNKPAAYEDPNESKYNSPAVSTVTVKWNEGDTNEQKLEKIITQKWIAMFPNGREAWSEFRRTGYPRLFPIIENNSGGTIDSKIMIRRLPFSKDEYNNNKAEVTKAVQMLGGPDSPGTKLWWDTNAGAAANQPNF